MLHELKSELYQYLALINPCRNVNIFIRVKFNKAVSQHVLVPVSPATNDCLVNLDLHFEELIVSKLSRTSQEAFMLQLDPATMEEIVSKRIRKEIMQTVFGKLLVSILI